jgi:hypothetical protein
MSGIGKHRFEFLLQVGLLAVQVLLPFGLYLTVNGGNRMLSYILAGLFGVSMLALVVLK